MKEISWYVGSTQRNQRQYIASKLITVAFLDLLDCWRCHGANETSKVKKVWVALLLRRFSSSPLVRRSLPNAAAIMSEYFSFKRKPGEGISQFLVRETLGVEEFSDALVQLKEMALIRVPELLICHRCHPLMNRRASRIVGLDGPLGGIGIQGNQMHNHPFMKPKKVMQKFRNKILIVHLGVVAHLHARRLKYPVFWALWILSSVMSSEDGGFW